MPTEHVIVMLRDLQHADMSTIHNEPVNCARAAHSCLDSFLGLGSRQAPMPRPAVKILMPCDV